MRKLTEISLKNKRVLLRCDFNVPLDSEGNILDDFRIKKSIPTIKYLIENGAKTILISHLDDPGGKVIEKLRLDKVRENLEKNLSNPVFKTEDCVGEKAKEAVKNLKSGEVLILENLRFHKGEESNDPEFARELAAFGDVYINEAFSVCHRAHASISGIPQYLPSFAGFLLDKEVSVLTDLIEDPKHPLTVIIGGAKVETKSKLIGRFLKIADMVLVSGLIKKEIDEKNIEFENSEKIIFPSGDLKSKDINEETVKIFKEKINESKTVFWNGPVGKFEEKEFAGGTESIAKAIAGSSAFSIVGGGETVEFINKLGLIDKFSHVSTGGGAMMAFLSGEKLPGLVALGN